MGEGQLAFVRFSVGLFGVSPLVGVMFVHGGRIAVAGRRVARPRAVSLSVSSMVEGGTGGRDVPPGRGGGGRSLMFVHGREGGRSLVVVWGRVPQSRTWPWSCSLREGWRGARRLEPVPGRAPNPDHGREHGSAQVHDGGSRPRSRSAILMFEWQPWIRIGTTVGRIAMTAVVSLRDPERAVVPVVVPTLTKYS